MLKVRHDYFSTLFPTLLELVTVFPFLILKIKLLKKLLLFLVNDFLCYLFPISCNGLIITDRLLKSFFQFWLEHKADVAILELFGTLELMESLS